MDYFRTYFRLFCKTLLTFLLRTRIHTPNMSKFKPSKIILILPILQMVSTHNHAIILNTHKNSFCFFHNKSVTTINSLISKIKTVNKY